MSCGAYMILFIFVYQSLTFINDEVGKKLEEIVVIGYGTQEKNRPDGSCGYRFGTGF
jgi:hypothetical protein